VDVVGASGSGATGRLSAVKENAVSADQVAMATWLRRMFRPARMRSRIPAFHDADAASALRTALAEAEEWAAHATALARVLRETKAAAQRLDYLQSEPLPSRAPERLLH
jgi:hypothetical protein